MVDSVPDVVPGSATPLPPVPAPGPAEAPAPAPVPAGGPAPAAAPARGVLARTVPLFGRVPLAVWRGQTVDALDLVRREGRTAWFVVVAGVAVVCGVTALLAIAVAGASFGVALRGFLSVAVLVLGFYVLRCVTVWWALRFRRRDVTFSAAAGLVATVATVHGLVAAVALVLGVVPGASGRVLQLVVVGPLLLLAVMVSEPLLYIGMARKAGPGRSILMPYVWFNLVFVVLVSVLALVTTLMGLAALWDSLT